MAKSLPLRARQGVMDVLKSVFSKGKQAMVKRETKAMQRARRILAEKQAAWDSTWQRIDAEKDQTMAKRIHFITDDDECPCGFEYEDDEQVSDDIDEVTCKKCIKAAEELEALEEEEELEGETEEEEVSAPAPMHLRAIFTLAPRNRDMSDTKEVLCTWLYQGIAKQCLNQPLRKVLVPQAQVDNQINRYLHPIVYVTFQEQSLEKYTAKGEVTEAPVSADVLENQTTMILNTIAPEKEKAMPKKPIVKVQTTSKPQATITEVVHANMPTPSALDAILATPIVAPTREKSETSDYIALAQHIMTPAPVGVPEEFLTRLAAPKRPLALPEERSEDALAQSMIAGSMPPSMYKAFLVAFKQALKEEGLVIVPEASLRHGCGEESAPVPAPEIWGSILDVPSMPAPLAPPAWGSELDAPAAHVKPQSTLTVFTGGNGKGAPKAQARAANSKTDPAIIKAIQKAWRNKTHTQAALAEKYGIDDKKVWYFCSSRCKQYV